MSQENVKVVRRMLEPYEGEDVIPMIRGAVERFGSEPDPKVVLAVWSQDPSWRYMDADFEWDASASGIAGPPVSGPTGVARWWGDWVEAWTRYVYRTGDLRDLGDWVLAPTEIQARARDDMPLEMQVFQLWKVRDGRITACRVFLSEAEALEAAGLRE